MKFGFPSHSSSSWPAFAGVSLCPPSRDVFQAIARNTCWLALEVALAHVQNAQDARPSASQGRRLCHRCGGIKRRLLPRPHQGPRTTNRGRDAPQEQVHHLLQDRPRLPQEPPQGPPLDEDHVAGEPERLLRTGVAREGRVQGGRGDVGPHRKRKSTELLPCVERSTTLAFRSGLIGTRCVWASFEAREARMWAQPFPVAVASLRLCLGLPFSTGRSGRPRQPRL